MTARGVGRDSLERWARKRGPGGLRDRGMIEDEFFFFGRMQELGLYFRALVVLFQVRERIVDYLRHAPSDLQVINLRSSQPGSYQPSGVQRVNGGGPMRNIRDEALERG